MTKEQIQQFTVRIASCNKTELVVITYDIILTYLDEAQNCYDANDVEGFLFNVKKARQYVNNLMTTLDLQYSIDKSLFQGVLKKKPVNFQCLNEMVERLKASFVEVAKQDTSKAVLNNTSEVHAGYTYSRGGGLNEMVMK